MITPEVFRRHFLRLILAAWLLPPVIGLGFILFINVLTPQQMLGILLTPTEPLYIVGWLVFSVWYFPRYIQPVSDYVSSAAETSPGLALERMQRFPLHFWSIFLVYLALAPGSVILSAEFYTDYVAQPVDWFRIHLVALIVSIIVGLPIFFLILDLFGRALGNLELVRPHVSIRTKIFLVGALVPLLIDTMLVQYYWTRTGFFTFETFLVWLVLELLAIAGSLVFVHSFAQSLAPLNRMIGGEASVDSINPSELLPLSTDELGVLASGYRKLLVELQRIRGNLEVRVDERTAELQATNQELESFSYSVSHDLRGPLRAIDGYSLALIEDCAADLAPACIEHLDRIRHSTQRMGELIDDLLALSRVGRQEISREAFDVQPLVEDVMHELEGQFPGRKIDLDIQVNGPMKGDRKLLRIVLGNLLGNAIKYSRDKETARITLSGYREGGESVYFVRDNGAGFDMAYSEKLFTAFQRLHHAGDYEGTGIGLAIVSRIIQRHGGRVWAEGEVDRGATFYFSLPEG